MDFSQENLDTETSDSDSENDQENLFPDEDLTLEATKLESRIPRKDEFIAPKYEKDECLECFCQPCVTEEADMQEWCPKSEHQPSEENDGYRYSLYRRFWTMLYNRGAFCCDKYMRK